MSNLGRYRVPLPPQAVLRAMFDYDATSGLLRWKDRAEWSAQHRGKYSGTVAGTHDAKGYIEVRFDGQAYLAHRLIWKWTYDQEPDDIDHRNRIKDDNRLSNLRECTHAGNTRNAAGWSKKHLPKGVHRRAESGRFRAIICFERRNINLGTFDTVEQAAAAYARAAVHYHGEFARTS